MQIRVVLLEPFCALLGCTTEFTVLQCRGQSYLSMITLCPLLERGRRGSYLLLGVDCRLHRLMSVVILYEGNGSIQTSAVDDLPGW